MILNNYCVNSQNFLYFCAGKSHCQNLALSTALPHQVRRNFENGSGCLSRSRFDIVVITFVCHGQKRIQTTLMHQFWDYLEFKINRQYGHIFVNYFRQSSQTWRPRTECKRTSEDGSGAILKKTHQKTQLIQYFVLYSSSKQR